MPSRARIARALRRMGGRRGIEKVMEKMMEVRYESEEGEEGMDEELAAAQEGSLVASCTAAHRRRRIGGEQEGDEDPPLYSPPSTPPSPREEGEEDEDPPLHYLFSTPPLPLGRRTRIGGEEELPAHLMEYESITDTETVEACVPGVQQNTELVHEEVYEEEQGGSVTGGVAVDMVAEPGGSTDLLGDDAAMGPGVEVTASGKDTEGDGIGGGDLVAEVEDRRADMHYCASVTSGQAEEPRLREVLTGGACSVTNSLSHVSGTRSDPSVERFSVSSAHSSGLGGTRWRPASRACTSLLASGRSDCAAVE